MTDAGLGHNRNRYGLDDSLDHVWVAHASYAALRPDVGGNALKRHDGNGPGVFGNLCLVGSNHIHDDAAL